MSGDWQEIAQLCQKMESVPEVQTRMDSLSRELRALSVELEQRRELLQFEREDLRRAEGFTLGALVLFLRGQRRHWLGTKREEHMGAEARFEACQRRIVQLEAERAEAAAFLAEMPMVEQRCRKLLESVRPRLAEVLPADRADDLERRFVALSKECVQRKEVEEAIGAAKQVLASLTPAVDALQQADSWAQKDSWNRGPAASAIKYEYLDDALSRLGDIDSDLERLADKLKDIGVENSMLALSLDAPSTTFRLIDVFFDNVFSDFRAAGKIGNGYQDAQALEVKVHDLIHGLERRRDRHRERTRHLEVEIGRLVQSLGVPADG